MEAEYGTYQYEKEKGMEKQYINIWYRLGPSQDASSAIILWYVL